MNAVGVAKEELDTPALCLDLDLFEENVRRVVAICREHSVEWRPHAKCHKSPVIAKRLVDAGAIGVTCATLRETETMANAGIRDLLLANMVAGKRKVAWLCLLAGMADVMICVDDIRQAEPISAALSQAGRQVRVLIEVEVGMNRVGVQSDEAVVNLAQQVDRLPGLQLAGLMAYEGHLLTLNDKSVKRERISAALGHVVLLKEMIESTGLACEILSCGGTGSFPITVELPGVTEIQAGGAIFMDAFYRDKCGIDFLEHALSVVSTVTSCPTADRVIIDAGRKSMDIAINTPSVISHGGYEVASLSAEHGLLTRSPSADALTIGDVVELLPGYGDMTNALHSRFFGTRNGIVVEEIEIVR